MSSLLLNSADASGRIFSQNALKTDALVVLFSPILTRRLRQDKYILPAELMYVR